MKKIVLVEDHCEVLEVWRRHKCLGLDLVHLDAHIDFGFYAAQSLEDSIASAKSVKDLKVRLESSLAFQSFEKDFGKQLNIGNYVYPAMREGIVRDFYWVVPGSVKDFKKSLKIIKKVLRNIVLHDAQKDVKFEDGRNGFLSFSFFGRRLIVCCLETLPLLKQSLLLDIDVDFLVMKNILEDDPTKDIGKRKPWIIPSELIKMVNSRIADSKITTIAYSVNGGWTPLRYKYLGDELAYQLAPGQFQKRFEKKIKAAQYFSCFQDNGEKLDYQKAVFLDPSYRGYDNNYGPLYLANCRYADAQKEFSKILNVDPENPAALSGLGHVAFGKKKIKKAVKYFNLAWRYANKTGLFKDIKKQLLLGLGQAEFDLRNFNAAKRWLSLYRTKCPLDSQAYYLLGRIAERKRMFPEAVIFYKDAMRLGFDTAQGLILLLRINRNLKGKSDILYFIKEKFFLLKKDLSKLKKALKARERRRLDKAIRLIEKKI